MMPHTGLESGVKMEDYSSFPIYLQGFLVFSGYQSSVTDLDFKHLPACGLSINVLGHLSCVICILM